ncbi:MAG TPA: NUDIX domain-containing protein [Thermosynechococcaceae cyanobacterium]
MTLNVAKDEAFGIVPILHQDNAYQFLLIQHHAGHWGFPKGHAELGETPLQSACREFIEETGISNYTVLEGRSFSEQYNFTRQGKAFKKTVVYFPALVQVAAVSFQKDEIRDYAWLDYDRAIALLSFSGARQVLTEVNNYLAAQGDRF